MLRILGIGALVAGGLAVGLAALVVAILLGPLVFWIAWNVLDFGPALGLVVITGIVFLADPSWFPGAAHVHWPEPTFRNFVAVALFALLASRPHAHKERRRRDKG